MKHMKKLIALALAVMSIMAIAVPALAESINAVPGASRVSDVSESDSGTTISRTVSCTLQSGDIVRVFLDVYNPERGYYVQRATVKFSTSGYHSATLSYTLDDNETTYRLRTYGYEDNSGTISVHY